MLATTEVRQTQKLEKPVTVKPPAPELYGIAEVDGEYEVTLPGLGDPASGLLVGTYRERFTDRTAAEDRIQRSRDDWRISRELASLDKTYAGDHFFNIQRTQDGRYKVTVPGAVDETGRFYFATTSFTFDTWDEAKAYFLETVKAEEKVIDCPLL